MFHTLDGMRGVAAVAVVIRHCDTWFAPVALPRSYLAVDLFFVLSGFVLAHAYDRRLRLGLTARGFLRLRLIRLYPLYGLGLVLGLLWALGRLAGGHAAALPADLLAAVTVFGLLMLPVPPGGPAPGFLYPLNLPAWSLFFELAVNLAYGLVARLLSMPALIGIVAASALALAITADHYGGLNLGAEWATFLGGVPRVSYSFFAGILVFRLFRTRRPHRCPVRAWMPLLVLPPLFLLAPAGWGAAFDLACVLLVFPVLVFWGAAWAPGAMALPLFSALGTTSYAIYALHQPLYRLLHGAAAYLPGFDLDRLAPWTGIAFVAILGVGCWLLDRCWDAPVRRRLARRARTTPPGALAGEAESPRRPDRPQ